MADGAAFAQRLMLEHDRPRLLAMTVGAGFIQSRHCKPACRLEYVSAMRVVTLHAIHSALNDEMVLGQFKFRMGLEMALEAGRRVFAGIDDEFAASTADFDVFAAGSVTGLATYFADLFVSHKVYAGVRAG